MRYLRIIAAYILLILSAAVYGGDAGKYSGEFLNLGAGARAAGMGNAFTAVKGDPYNVFWNPAGLVEIKYKTLSYMFNQMVESTNYSYLTYTHPLSNSVLAASFAILSYGSLPVYEVHNDSPVNVGSFDGKDMVLQGTYSNSVYNGKILLGINAKYINSDISGYTAGAFAVDAGFILNLSEDLSIGGVLQNAGGKLKYLEEKESLPLTVKLGCAYNLINDYVMLTGDIIKKGAENIVYSGGIEMKLINRINVRSGFNSGNDITSGGLTLGFGYYSEKLSLDYAYIPYSDFGNAHKLSMEYRFGSKIKRTKIKKIKVSAMKENVPSVKEIEEIPVKSFNDYFNEGVVDIKIKDYKSALYNFNKSLKIEKYNISARLWLAYTYVKLGEYKKAVNEYQTVLLMDPENKNALSALKRLK